ncbi:HlyD family efflux transporter periplasmic adaptor subunit [Paracoccus liaowanqingii]|uniref:HlyD family efflux transporter periplasmic adaptor subunit n=1 Tax=Paracoccus liaowanqingii TaxID=2560053 RepID=A0A4Z1CHH1_9RHOB|nr:HlyD family efflux transporter periplasmic adaptor subunit [Paracoccus liaowanqingii]TGN61609.1 HlyD family efflux transporter periplasmic adaptor subunit [Paracoccus liaowanqingii]
MNGRRASERLEKDAPLFRAEAVAEQQDRWLGTVLLVPRISHVLWTGVATFLVAGVIGLVGFGEYTRKSRLQGSLVPEGGLIQVMAPQPGVLTKVSVTEGKKVVRGAALAVLSIERRSETMGETQGEVVRALRARRDALVKERDRHIALFDGQDGARQRRMQGMNAALEHLQVEFELQHSRVDLSRNALDRQRALRQRNLVTEETLRSAEEEALDQALALQTLERQRSTLDLEKLDIEVAHEEAPFRRDLQLSEIDRSVAALDQEIAEAEAAREIVIAAPQSGTVTALQASAGSSAGPDMPLMTLVPEDSYLEARLYGPSSAIGFVRPGQRAMIRYEAYPYQKFGLYEGVVASVSRSTIGHLELAAAGISTVTDSGSEPVYRVTVRLAAQSATAYGEDAPLQPGMTLSADIVIETRRIYQWILDPLYSLTGEGKA